MHTVIIIIIWVFLENIVCHVINPAVTHSQADVFSIPCM